MYSHGTSSSSIRITFKLVSNYDKEIAHLSLFISSYFNFFIKHCGKTGLVLVYYCLEILKFSTTMEEMTHFSLLLP